MLDLEYLSLIYFLVRRFSLLITLFFLPDIMHSLSNFIFFYRGNSMMSTISQFSILHTFIRTSIHSVPSVRYYHFLHTSNYLFPSKFFVSSLHLPPTPSAIACLVILLFNLTCAFINSISSSLPWGTS